MPENLVVTRTDRIVEIALDRPEKRNALTAAMYAGLADAIAEADRDPRVAAVVISGAPHFTSGNDVADFLKAPPTSHTDETPTFRFLNGIATATVPIVAAVTGYATGVGTTMLLHCDVVVAGTSARFHTPFVDLALVPEAGSSLLLPLVVGARRASRMLMLGEPLDAATALACDLVTEVVPDETAVERARAYAAAFAAKPPQALRRTKQLLRAGAAEALRAQMDREGALFLEALRSDEAAEAMRAFLEKRPPRWVADAAKVAEPA